MELVDAPDVYRTSPELVRVVDAIVRAADLRDQSGIRVIQLAVGDLRVEDVVGAAMGALGRLGFEVVRTDLVRPDSVRDVRLHRHLVLFAPEHHWYRTADATVEWIRALTAASPRAHLLVLLKRAGLWCRQPAPVVRECAPDLVAPPCPAVAALIGAGELERAEAAVHANLAEAAVRGMPPPPAARLGLVEVLFWQGRFHEAAAAAMLAGEGPAARFWRGLTEWACRRSPVRIADGPVYLQKAALRRTVAGGGDEHGAPDLSG